MRGRMDPLPNRQCAQMNLLRLGIPALIRVENGQIIEHGRNIRMIGPEPADARVERAAHQGLALRATARSRQGVAEVVLHPRDRRLDNPVTDGRNTY